MSDHPVARIAWVVAATLRGYPDKPRATGALRMVFNDYLRLSSEEERAALRRSGYSVPLNSAHFAAGIQLPWISEWMARR